MSACEVCWGRASSLALMTGGSVVDHYRTLLAESPDGHESTAPWIAANDGTGKRRWFICRDVENSSLSFKERYHFNSRGDLIRYSSFESASAAAARLNEEDA